MLDDRASGDIFAVSRASATFDNASSGTNKAVTVGGISIGGTDADLKGGLPAKGFLQFRE